MDLKGKHVLITGGAKRLGRAIGESLLSDGIQLTLHYLSSGEAANDFVEKARSQGHRVQGVKADLRSVTEIEAAVHSAGKTFGPIDILINSASLFYPKKALETEASDWDALMDVNLRGQFFFAKFSATQMLSRTNGSGLIINFGDVSATTGAKNFTAYVCAKAGLLMMTKNLAKEWAPHIRVNSISPGPVLEPEDYTATQRENSAARTLLKRWGSPDDVVAAVRFLIASNYITGIDLKVDGGRSVA